MQPMPQNRKHRVRKEGRLWSPRGSRGTSRGSKRSRLNGDVRDVGGPMGSKGTSRCPRGSRGKFGGSKVLDVDRGRQGWSQEIKGDVRGVSDGQGGVGVGCWC